jgi:ATP-dependent Lon protease
MFTDRPVRHDVVMTGEISLRGRVLPWRSVAGSGLATAR